MTTRLNEYVELPAKTEASEDFRLDLQIGLEFELEGVDMQPDKAPKFMMFTGDGTLRDNGLEVLFRRPMNGVKALEAIDGFYKMFDFNGLRCSELCSTHLHMNMAWATFKQAAACSWLLAANDMELYSITGSEKRVNNIYALPSSINRGFHIQVRNLWKKREIRLPRIGNARYRSVNIMPMDFFSGNGAKGSVEIRHSSVITDKDTLMKYINLAMETIAPVYETRDREMTKARLNKMLLDMDTPVSRNIARITGAIL